MRALRDRIVVVMPGVLAGVVAGVIAIGAVLVMPGVDGVPVASADANEAPPGIGSFVQGRIAAGEQHNCAIGTDGRVRCWGSNRYGELGVPANMSANPTQPPVDLGAGRSATAIAAGLAWTCALLDDGTVRCWGANDTGQLGTPPNDVANPTPQPPVDLGAGRFATAIAGGREHVCALLDNGDVRCWGKNSSGQIGNGPTVALGRDAVAISGGWEHTCAVLDDGTVRCWGSNNARQLGSPNGEGTTTSFPNPQPPVDVLAGRTATAISAGWYNTCALLVDGKVRCWGSSVYGERGAITKPRPTVDLGAGRSAVAITTGFSHSCALLDDGTVRCWGRNRYGELGSPTNYGTDTPNPTTQPPVALGRRAIAITAGGSHTCAVLDDASVRCWGWNLFRQLGPESPSMGLSTSSPIPLAAVDGVAIGTTDPRAVFTSLAPTRYADSRMQPRSTACSATPGPDPRGRSGRSRSPAAAACPPAPRR
jgi:alpha-tubulin suppressor-like RCC1 family protein